MNSKIIIKQATIVNDVGGTSELPLGSYLVSVERTWNDYETGKHGKGKLVQKGHIDIARKIGTTGYTVNDFKKYGQKMMDEVEKAQKDFDPSTVYFIF
jgi:hypothetical protein